MPSAAPRSARREAWATTTPAARPASEIGAAAPRFAALGSAVPAMTPSTCAAIQMSPIVAEAPEVEPNSFRLRSVVVRGVDRRHEVRLVDERGGHHRAGGPARRGEQRSETGAVRDEPSH